MIHKTRLHGVCCVLLMGCAAGSAESQNPEQSQNVPSEEPAAWGHSEGGMPAMGGADVGRTGDGSHLRYWGGFWKTPTVSNAYDVYDMTIAGQLIVTHYVDNVQQGESECHFVVNHIDEQAEIDNYRDSYLFLQNVAGGATPFSYVALHKKNTGTVPLPVYTLFMCFRNNADDTRHTFSSQALAEADLDYPEGPGRLNADEELEAPGQLGCNKDISFTPAPATVGRDWLTATVYTP